MCVGDALLAITGEQECQGRTGAVVCTTGQHPFCSYCRDRCVECGILACAPSHTDLVFVLRAGADLGAILSEAQLLAINETVESMEQQQQQQQVVQQQATVKAKRQAPAGQQPSAVRDLAGASAVANAEPPGVQGTPIEAPSASEPAAPDSRGPVVRMSHLLRAQAAARPSLPAAEAARLAALYDRFRRDREAPAARAAAGEHGAGGKRATLA